MFQNFFVFLQTEMKYDTMKRLKWMILAGLCLYGTKAAAQDTITLDDRPKLVVGVVVDQMRWDYLARYYNEFTANGFRRLTDQGYSCNNTMINYLPTVTAVGHASIYTGTTPAFHGIAGNNFLTDGVRTSSVRDTTVTTVGSDVRRVGQASPRRLLATTIGDQMKLHTDFRAKVYSVSFKDRAAVLPGGHAADGAFWLDTRNIKFVTSSYYMDELPEWLNRYNEQLKAHEYLRTQGDTAIYSPMINKMVIELGKAVVRGERLGHHDVPDMLTVSLSQTDFLGHKYGTRGWRIDNMYKMLDEQLAGFLDFLDEEVGRGNYLLFLTADHGAAHNNLFLEEHRIPAGIWRLTDVQRQLESHMRSVFGDDLVLYIIEYRVYLDWKKMREKGLDPKRVKAEAAAFLARQPEVAYAFDFEQASEAGLPDVIRQKVMSGRNPERSGDVQVILNPGYYYFAPTSSEIGTTHAGWNPYDSHIPLLFYGWGVPHGSTSRPTYITDIAATVCNMLHIQVPDACVGHAIELK